MVQNVKLGKNMRSVSIVGIGATPFMNLIKNDTYHGLTNGELFGHAALDAMKQSGEFDELVKTFNDTQAEINKNSNDKYTYAGVKESKELSEKQVSGVKSYFVELSAPYVPDIKEEALDIKEGYEVTYNYKKNNEDAGDETVIVVSLNNEGWKVITR